MVGCWYKKGICRLKDVKNIFFKVAIVIKYHKTNKLFKKKYTYKYWHSQAKKPFLLYCFRNLHLIHVYGKTNNQWTLYSYDKQCILIGSHSTRKTNTIGQFNPTRSSYYTSISLVRKPNYSLPWCLNKYESLQWSLPGQLVVKLIKLCTRIQLRSSAHCTIFLQLPAASYLYLLS